MRNLRIAIYSLPKVFTCINALDECLPKSLPELHREIPSGENGPDLKTLYEGSFPAWHGGFGARAVGHVLPAADRQWM